MIQVTDLVKRYGTATAVDGISFSVEEGEIIGFLGPNGAGKTTTMNILTGCIEATEGTASIGGADIAEAPDQARRMIGYLPELPPLYPDMTVEEYLDFVYGLKKCRLDRDVHIPVVLGMAGLTEVRGRLIRNLSKGYKQRVGLAQALIGNPPVLILDEPTVGLDPKQIIEIREVIRSLGQKHTVILSSHILPEVQAVCDRVLVINKGKIVADGTAEELAGHMEQAEQLELIVEGEPQQVLATLEAVPGVAGVELAKEDGRKSTYRVTAESGADVRREVFESLSQSMLAILSMKQVEMNLEDIFLQLTGEDVPLDGASIALEEEPEAEDEPEAPKKRRLFGRKGGKKQ